METKNSLSNEYLKSRYDSAPYGILILTPSGKKVKYANLAATVSMECLLDGNDVSAHLCDGWEQLLSDAKTNRQTVFIPFKNRKIFTYLRVTPIFRNNRVVGFLGNTVQETAYPSIPLATLEHIGNEITFEKLLNTLSTAIDECRDKDTGKALKRMYRNTIKLYNHRRDYVDFIAQNYFLSKEEKTVFSLSALLTLVNKTTFRLELNKTSSSRANALYVRGVFELYRIMIEQVIYFMLSQTNDPSPVTVNVDFCNGRINMTFIKRGTSPKGHSRMRKTEKGRKQNPPLIQLMEPILSSSNVTVDFDTGENLILAKVNMDYVTENNHGENDDKPSSKNVTDISESDMRNYKDYYLSN